MSHCSSCGQTYHHDCGCNQTSDTGCPIQLDFSCILYHKDNNEVTELDGLSLTNGATLELFAETVDEKIKQLNVSSWNIGFLRGLFTINSLQQFGESVNQQLESVDADITTLTGLVNLPITPIDSSSVNITISGIGNHSVKADVIVSPTSNNQLSILPDGVYVTPQTLTANYSTKELTISGGNTVDLSGLFSNYLGEVTSDPVSPSNGQYWFRTDSSTLKIRVNGITKTITTT